MEKKCQNFMCYAWKTVSCGFSCVTLEIWSLFCFCFTNNHLQAYRTIIQEQKFEGSSRRLYIFVWYQWYRSRYSRFFTNRYKNDLLQDFCNIFDYNLFKITIEINIFAHHCCCAEIMKCLILCQKDFELF